MQEKILIPTTYNIDDLFGSVNDIYEQYDSGKITKAQANEILIRCCFSFVNNSNNYPSKPNLGE
jgi:hypothetical protein